MDWLTWQVVVAISTVVGALAAVVGVTWQIQPDVIRIPCRWIVSIFSKVLRSILKLSTQLYRLLIWRPYWVICTFARRKAIEDYKHELSDHIWMQEMPLKNDEDACLIPFDMKNNREAYKEILKVNFIAAGKGIAYRDILNHMFEPGTAPRQPDGYHHRRTNANFYKWGTEGTGLGEKLVLVSDDREIDALLSQKPPDDEPCITGSSTEAEDTSCTE